MLYLGGLGLCYRGYKSRTHVFLGLLLVQNSCIMIGPNYYLLIGSICIFLIGYPFKSSRTLMAVADVLSGSSSKAPVGIASKSAGAARHFEKQKMLRINIAVTRQKSCILSLREGMLFGAWKFDGRCSDERLWV